MRAALERWLNRVWYEGSPSGFALLPFSALYGLITAGRRWLYQRGWFTVHRVECPVIVVGNVTVGGTGKTPFTIALVERLQASHYRVAVISRGYGGALGVAPHVVMAEDSASLVGDEPALIARRTSASVIVCKDRVAAARRACELGVDVIVADDGLQHYRLGRDLEIAITDASRGFGNGRLLPAGPLREPVKRLSQCGLVFMNGPTGSDEPGFSLAPAASLTDLPSRRTLKLTDAGQYSWVAMAAISAPMRFFATLQDAGLHCEKVALPDHAPQSAYPLDEYLGSRILVTEKDAVKLAGAKHTEIWVLSVSAVLNAAAQRLLDSQLDALKIDTRTS